MLDRIKIDILQHKAEFIIQHILSHGAGINDQWYYEVENNTIYFSNSFDSIDDESGAYCCNIPFSFRLTFNVNTLHFTKMSSIKLSGNYECGYCDFGLNDYLDEMLWDDIHTYFSNHEDTDQKITWFRNQLDIYIDMALQGHYLEVYETRGL